MVLLLRDRLGPCTSDEDLSTLHTTSVNSWDVAKDGIGCNGLIAAANIASWKGRAMGLVHFRSRLDMTSKLGRSIESMHDNIGGDVKEIGKKFLPRRARGPPYTHVRSETRNRGSVSLRLVSE